MLKWRGTCLIFGYKDFKLLISNGVDIKVGLNLQKLEYKAARNVLIWYSWLKINIKNGGLL